MNTKELKELHRKIADIYIASKDEAYKVSLEARLNDIEAALRAEGVDV